MCTSKSDKSSVKLAGELNSVPTILSTASNDYDTLLVDPSNDPIVPNQGTTENGSARCVAKQTFSTCLNFHSEVYYPSGKEMIVQ